jgi:hypothetical protein
MGTDRTANFTTRDSPLATHLSIGILSDKSAATIAIVGEEKKSEIRDGVPGKGLAQIRDNSHIAEAVRSPQPVVRGKYTDGVAMDY